MNIKREKKHNFIESLIQLTEKNMISWAPMRRYLDKNTNYQFQNYLINVLEKRYINSNSNKYSLELKESFVTTVNDSIIFLLCIDREYNVFIQNSVEARVQETSFNSKNSPEVNLLIERVKDNISSEEITIKRVIDLAKDLDEENF